MNTSSICPDCKTPIPVDAPSGVCPTCMIGLGLSDSPERNQDRGNGYDGSPTEATNPAKVAVDAAVKSPSEISSATSEKIAAAEAASMQRIAEGFPQLEILEKLGQGGMGAVYKVRQITLDRIVALKVLPPALEEDPSFTERFQREARALARLSHPNIVMIFEFGVTEGFHYFLMEFVDGVNLREAIATGGLSPVEALQVVPQICEALQFAHDEGIVHRDIKPENVLLDKRGRVKIADFGLAKILRASPEDFTLTATNQLVGTPRYMAPEQIENPLTVDHRSDIYSLGVVFYEMLTGELPLGRFDAPSKRNESAVGVDDIVMRTLEKEPDRRYQQASEVSTAVQQATYQAGYDARPQTPFPQPSAVRLPTIPVEVNHNLTVLYSVKGLLKIDEEARQIFMDLQVKDNFGGMFKSEFKQVHVGLDHLVSIKHEKRWFEPIEITLQTDAIRELAELPGAERGRVRLNVERDESEQCDHLVNRVKALIGAEDVADTIVAAKQIVDRSDSIEAEMEDFSRPRRKLRMGGIGMLIACVFDFICSIILFAMMMDHFDDDVVPFAFILFGGALFFVPVMICAAIELLKVRSLKTARRLTLISMIPLHPGCIFTIPFGVVVLRTLRSIRDREIESSLASQEAEVRTDAPTSFAFRFVGVYLVICGIVSAIIMLISSGIGVAMMFESHGPWIAPFMVAFIAGIGTTSIFFGWRICWGASRRKMVFYALFLMMPVTWICVATIPAGVFLLIHATRERQSLAYGNPYE